MARGADKWRAVYFTDLHLWNRDISSRLDQSSRTALAKLRFVCQYALGQGLDQIISGGDITADTIDSDEYKGEILDAIISCKVPFVTGVGNHDVSYRQFANFKYRAVNIFHASKVAPILTTQFLESRGILGINAYDESIVDRLTEAERQKVTVIFAHHYINSGPDRLVLDVKALKEKLPNLFAIFTGHDHQEYPEVVSHGVYIYRPGGALRVSSAKENVERVPKFMVLTFEGSNLVRVEPVPFLAAPASEVFNLGAKQVIKSSEQEFDEFVENVQNARTVGIDLQAVINEKLAKMNDGSESYQDLVEDVHNDYATLASHRPTV